MHSLRSCHPPAFRYACSILLQADRELNWVPTSRMTASGAHRFVPNSFPSGFNSGPKSVTTASSTRVTFPELRPVCLDAFVSFFAYAKLETIPFFTPFYIIFHALFTTCSRSHCMRLSSTS